jgi:hypothetical protein
MKYTMKIIEISNKNQKVRFAHRRNSYFYVTVETEKNGFKETYTESYDVNKANNLYKTLMNASWTKTYEVAY